MSTLIRFRGEDLGYQGRTVLAGLELTVTAGATLVRDSDPAYEVAETHAKAGGILALPVILTGVWLWKKPKARLWHQIAVYLWLAAVLTATGTGLWMFGLGTLKAG